MSSYAQPPSREGGPSLYSHGWERWVGRGPAASRLISSRFIYCGTNREPFTRYIEWLHIAIYTFCYNIDNSKTVFSLVCETDSNNMPANLGYTHQIIIDRDMSIPMWRSLTYLNNIGQMAYLSNIKARASYLPSIPYVAPSRQRVMATTVLLRHTVQTYTMIIDQKWIRN